MRREIKIICDMERVDREIKTYKDIIGRYEYLGILIPVKLQSFMYREIERLEEKLEILKNM